MPNPDDKRIILGAINEEQDPYSWIYFISFILVTSVVLLNMVIGIIVDVMSRDARENLFDNVETNDHVVTEENKDL